MEWGCSVANNLRPCFDCQSGFFVKIQKPKSYDYNTEGYVPRCCNLCGLCNDSTKIVIPHLSSATLANRFIKQVLQIICKNMLKKDYTFKAELFKLLKNKVFFNVYDLAEEITSHCQGRGYNITEDHILKIIYSELDYSAFT